jgi:hypothetical protein
MPVIAVTGCRRVDTKTSALLIAIGLKQSARAVHLVNLDKQTNLPPIAPLDENPDLIVINCPLERAELLRALPKSNRINLLILDDQPHTFSDNFTLLQDPGRFPLARHQFHCLTVNMPSTAHGVFLFKHFENAARRFFNSQLLFFGATRQSEDIANFIQSGYSISNLNYSLALYQKVISDLRRLITD